VLAIELALQGRDQAFEDRDRVRNGTEHKPGLADNRFNGEGDQQQRQRVEPRPAAGKAHGKHGARMGPVRGPVNGRIGCPGVRVVRTWP
jgi:hypothetical protein